MPALGACPTAFSVDVGATYSSSTFALFQDSVTTVKNNGTIICAQNVSFYAASAPSPIANQTMHSKFTYAATSSTSTSGTQTISAAPTLPSELGTYNLNAVACVTSNPTSCKVLCSVAVTVTHPCDITQITGPAQIQNFLTFAGQNLTSTSSYTFNDSVSVNPPPSTVSSDFCGEKTFAFKINSESTTLLSGINTQKIKFSPPANSTVFGTLLAEMIICVKDNPNANCKSRHFNVTTLSSKPPLIPDQYYTVNSPTLSIVPDPFQLIPRDFVFTSPPVTTYQLYLVSEGINLAQTDLNYSCLELVKTQSWIQFSNQSGNNTITIQTSNNSFAGQHQVALVQTFSDFPDVKYFSQFKINVSPFIAKVIDLKPTQNLVKIQHTLGSKPLVLNLLQYYQVSSISNIEIKLSAIQTSSLPIQNFKISAQNEFSLQADDESLEKSKAYFQISITTNLVDLIPNDELVIEISFKKSVTKASEQILENGQATFDQKVNFIFQGFQKKPSPGPADPNAVVKKSGALISTISQLGEVTIQFNQPVFVPKFQEPRSLSSTKSQSQQVSDKSTFSLNLQQFIDSQVIRVKLVRNQGTQNIDWNCTNMTNSTVQLQLYFKNPLEISSYGPDKIQVEILQPNLFILNSENGFLFREDTNKILTAQIPPQFPSKKALQVFQEVQATVTKAAPQIIVITLLVQIIAKKVISSVFIFYSVLQIILLISLEANVQLPASVEMVFHMIDGILNLSSLDMNMILSSIKLPEIQKDSLVAKLSGVSLAILIVLAFVVIILVIRKLKLSEKLKNFVNKVFKFVFWNFLIRYLQVSIINLNYASLTTILTTDNLLDKIMSANILALLYLLVCLVAYILCTRKHEYLCLNETKQRIGNLYLNLRTDNKAKTFFGAMFYIQRVLIVVIIALKADFGVQFCLIHTVLLVNTFYLFSSRPYIDWADARVDYFNTLFLLATESVFALTSPLVTDTQIRYQNGIYFDCLLGIGFIVNILNIAFLTFIQIQLKFKQYLFRRNLKQKRLTKKLEKEQLETEQKLKQQAAEIQNQKQPENSTTFTNAVVKKNPLFAFQQQQPLNRNKSLQQTQIQKVNDQKTPGQARSEHPVYQRPNISQNQSIRQQTFGRNAALQNKNRTEQTGFEESFDGEIIPQTVGFKKNKPNLQYTLPEWDEVETKIEADSEWQTYGQDSTKNHKQQSNFQVQVISPQFNQSEQRSRSNPPQKMHETFEQREAKLTSMFFGLNQNPALRQPNHQQNFNNQQNSVGLLPRTDYHSQTRQNYQSEPRVHQNATKNFQNQTEWIDQEYQIKWYIPERRPANYGKQPFRRIGDPFPWEQQKSGLVDNQKQFANNSTNMIQQLAMSKPKVSPYQQAPNNQSMIQQQRIRNLEDYLKTIGDDETPYEIAQRQKQTQIQNRQPYVDEEPSPFYSSFEAYEKCIDEANQICKQLTEENNKQSALANPKPQEFYDLEEALKGLSPELCHSFKSVFGDLPGKVKVQLAEHFRYMESIRPPKNAQEFLQKLAEICSNQYGLYENALAWLKTNGKDGKFAKQYNVDWLTAFNYRNENIIVMNLRFINAGKDLEKEILSFYGNTAQNRLKYYEFKKLPSFEFDTSISQQLRYHFATQDSQMLRKFYPDLYKLSGERGM